MRCKMLSGGGRWSWNGRAQHIIAIFIRPSLPPSEQQFLVVAGGRETVEAHFDG